MRQAWYSFNYSAIYGWKDKIWTRTLLVPNQAFYQIKLLFNKRRRINMSPLNKQFRTYFPLISTVLVVLDCIWYGCTTTPYLVELLQVSGIFRYIPHFPKKTYNHTSFTLPTHWYYAIGYVLLYPLAIAFCVPIQHLLGTVKWIEWNSIFNHQPLNMLPYMPTFLSTI